MKCVVMMTVCAGLFVGFAGIAKAQPGSAFSYQGRATNGGVLIDGTINVQLSLWKDAFSLNAADRIGSVQTINNVPVSDGVFTVVANGLNEFGLNPFNGQAIWLQVAINGVNQNPRHQILSTPYASGLTGGGGAINNSSGTTTFSFINQSTATNGASTLLVRRGGASGISLGTYFPGAIWADSGNVNGIVASVSGTGAYGIFGLASGTGSAGVVGKAAGPNSAGVMGMTDVASSPGISGITHIAASNAILGTASSGSSTGVRGIAPGSSSNGVWGTADGNFGAGVYGTSSGENGLGVYGRTTGPNGKAVYGTATGADVYAGYFVGRVYAGGAVGINTDQPLTPLDVEVAPGQRLQVRLDQFVPGINVSNSGANAGILRLRNAMEVWPSDDATRAGRLDVRNTAGAVTIVMNGANGSISATGTITPSSGRLKENVVPMADALERLLALDGVRFDWTEEEAAKRGGKVHDIGFIAEKVAQEFPEVVFRDESGEVIGMDYARLTAVTVQAIKQQQAKFEAELSKRDLENAELKARLEKLEARR